MEKDYFSTQSAAYSAFRPCYPPTLYAALCSGLDADAVIWDCATGSGQAARDLARYAAFVVASDMSVAQLKKAPVCDNVGYVQALAESMPLADGSIDLITVAQALHWFDLDRFYAEAQRVLKPGGCIAAWTYSFLAVSAQLGPAIDAVVRWFYHDVIGPFWPPERRWVDDRYRSISFPFRERAAPAVAIAVSWDLQAVLGYIGSWSAVALYTRAHGQDPLPLLAERLAPVWGEPDAVRALDWPLDLRFGVRA